MFRLNHAFFATFLLAVFACCSAVQAARPNVLFIAVDDLRPELGCETLYVNGPVFGKLQLLEKASDVFPRGEWIDFARCRKVALSRDGGQTWSALRDDPALIEPQCQGTILRYSDPLDGQRSRILFANPASQSGRENGMIRMSYDEGRTWPVGKTVYPGGFAYSCLTVLPDGSIGLLYERDGYRAISFCRVTLGWLTDGEDSDARK